MAGFKRLRIDAEPNACAVGHVGRPLAFEIRQQQKAIAARRDAARFGRKALVCPLEIVADHFGGDGHVHGAEQREPLVGGVTECGDLAFGIDDRFVRAGVDCSARAKAGCDDARSCVAGANRAHHVVAAAGTDQHVRIQTELLGR